jgi:N-glycosylase/DNA lyase
MMLSIPPSRLKRAVSVVCHDIELHVRNTASMEFDEAALWRELSCCILSSQVPYALAQSAADEIHLTGILASKFNRSTEDIQSQLLKTLSGRFAVGLSYRRYRFPKSRSRQLALSWEVIHEQGGLSNWLAKTRDIHEARRWLVAHVPGLGPKQASMFLRNSGITYKLAILDRHVLRYMDIIGLEAPGIPQTSNLSAYRTHELLLQTHADEVGYPVGLLDWAIWIVMRVAGSGTIVRRSS